jgi:hypothetical protein
VSIESGQRQLPARAFLRLIESSRPAVKLMCEINQARNRKDGSGYDAANYDLACSGIIHGFSPGALLIPSYKINS